ncbi:MAG: hypothetical protein WCY00_01580 [Candidatus Dojkabacteria bacterium]|jgi:hypothetical protein
MEEEKKKEGSFLLGLSITLGTIVVGLVSYIIFSTDFKPNTEIPRCEYRGWAYAHGEKFTMQDGCNVCICSHGELTCTDIVCSQESMIEDLN